MRDSSFFFAHSRKEQAFFLSRSRSQSRSKILCVPFKTDIYARTWRCQINKLVFPSSPSLLPLRSSLVLPLLPVPLLLPVSLAPPASLSRHAATTRKTNATHL